MSTKTHEEIITELTKENEALREELIKRIKEELPDLNTSELLQYLLIQSYLPGVNKKLHPFRPTLDAIFINLKLETLNERKNKQL